MLYPISLTPTQNPQSQEIMDRTHKASRVADEPMLFDDNILNDMQSALLKLERRVQEGPGSLSILDVEELSGEMSRIMKEMHQNPHRRALRPSERDASDSNPSTLQNPPKPLESVQSEPKRTVIDTSNDEGPAYDGTGGMGQPQGTVNTYVIEGMDGMSPEEYQKALQDSIIERQRKRRASGTTGNRATWDYLTSLGGSTGVIKTDEDSKADQDDDNKKDFKPF